jgi:drug/metabolite transporter superfamily protein YnfA
MYGLTRATTTLIAAAAAGLLIWIATQIDDTHVGGFWAVYGLIAGAGLVMALSQLLGGWTKWGWPRLSAKFLLLAFVPIAVVSLWILLAAEPGNGWFHRHVLSWSGDIHVRGLVNDLQAYVPIFAFGIGLVFGYSFDTTGPRRDVVAPPATTTRRGLFGRRRAVAPSADGRVAADEPVTRARPRSDDEVPASDRDRVTTN